MTRKALAALLAVSTLPALAQTGAVTAPADASSRIAADAQWLSADALKGRKAGTAEADAAADRLAEEFRRNGILPGGEKGTYFQTFDFIDGVDLGPKNALATAGTAPVGRSWKLGTDFAPLTFSAPGELSGEVVFAGYGIASKELGYDDYAGLDVKGKVVLVLRYAPSGDDPKSDFAPYMALRYTAGIAREKGATAILVATGPN
ncbi:MAG: hypothetical protein JNK60_16760, partial [Acidobacteria bacterium]|nr:hypothetical protein [Acidobacteriota bacterium]